MLVPLLLFVQILIVTAVNQYQKPIAEKIWSVRCNKHDHVLNDCNWCWCGPNQRFQCKARVCEQVDVFGHFKDTIQEIDVGMEGHGVWRTLPTSCTPGVQYQRGSVLCVCDDDGYWPNPVCRDLFRILHVVEVVKKAQEKTLNACSPTKLYLVGCNTCFCPSSGKIDAKLCTNRTCSDNDPVLDHKYDELKKVKEDEEVKIELSEETDREEVQNADKGDFKLIRELNDQVDIDDLVQPEGGIRNEAELEVYAPCDTQRTYTMGSQKCECLSSNRLICKERDDILIQQKKLESYLRSTHGVCWGNAGETINFECNVCLCVEKGFMFCTLKVCVQSNKNHKKFREKMPKWDKAPIGPALFDELECLPDTYFKRGCNTCYCRRDGDHNTIICKVNHCGSKKDYSDLIHDCVPDTTYDTRCMRCSCYVIDGKKYESCSLSPQCRAKKLKVIKIESLDSLNGACVPGARYQHSCNTCTCMPNGVVMKCTSDLCGARSGAPPIEVDIVPLRQALRETCPKGHSYKVQCNLCVCLSNGNALCSTKDCSTTGD